MDGQIEYKGKKRTREKREGEGRRNGGKRREIDRRGDTCIQYLVVNTTLDMGFISFDCQNR